MSGMDVQTGFPDLDTVEGVENPRCAWDESVCTASVEYRIRWEGGDDPAEPLVRGEVELLCPRHYALSLARLLEVHEPQCEHTAVEHLAEYGPLSGGE
ncbi:hypothetical protein [Kocuria sp.]|uniref:hypothetical protein n=1 Tax=Kocuria sp. TaxID=1871328 RepID=UPI0026DD08BE|nr:hypothetical protein [Kocuria sp.]MDO4918242.1 hypothetical protein [Kocuria sp.]